MSAIRNQLCETTKTRPTLEATLKAGHETSCPSGEANQGSLFNKINRQIDVVKFSNPWHRYMSEIERVKYESQIQEINQ